MDNPVFQPCPFCREGGNHMVHYRYDGCTIMVACFCGAIGPRANELEPAVRAWNTRPIETALRAELASAHERIAKLEADLPDREVP